jgi:hypothetical protein
MRIRRGTGLVTCLLLMGLMLVGPSAGQALAVGHVRFLQAQPGGPSATLQVTVVGYTTTAGGPSSFGQLTPYANVPAGAATLEIVGSSEHASSTLQVVDGARYTVVAVGSPSATRLRVYDDGPAHAGTARLRIIQLAPELGAPDVRLGGRTIAQGLSFEGDTGYIDVTPGSYQLALMAPQRTQPIVSDQVALAAGTASSAIVTGTGGAPERLQLAEDDTVVPGGAPETGLGGLARGGGVSALLVALAALGGGLAGGAAFLVGRRKA